MEIDLLIATSFQQLSKISLFDFAQPLISKIGKGDFLLFVCILLALYAYFAGKSKTMKTASAGMFALLLAGTATQILKRLLGRARPGMNLGDFHFIGPNFFKNGFDSFPSGHATASFTIASFFSFFYPRLKTALYLLATIVSLGRVIYGYHFLTDLLAGAMLGIVVGRFVAKKLKKWILTPSPNYPMVQSPNRSIAQSPFPESHLPNLLLILAFSAIPLFYGLNNYALWDRDETEYAQAALEMQQKNEWWMPTVGNQPYLEKPIFMYWLTRISYLLFGFSEFSSRFPSAIFGIFTLIATYFLASCLWGKRAARLAALILSTSFLFVGCYRMLLTDSFFVFFTTAALLFYVQSLKKPERSTFFLALSYIFIGFGVLSKGPIAFFPLFVFLIYELCSSPSRWGMRHFCFSLIALAIAAPWYLYSFSVEKSGTASFFFHHNIARFFQAFEGHSGPMIYHLFVLAIGLLPWSFFLIPAVAKEWKDRVSAHASPLQEGSPKAEVCESQSLLLPEPPLLLLGLWISIIFVLFSLSATKLPHYMLPVLPAMACILGKSWDEQLGYHIPLQERNVPFHLPFLLTILLIGLMILSLLSLYFFRPLYASLRLIFPFLILFLFLIAGLLLSKRGKQQKSFFSIQLGAFLLFVTFAQFSLPWVENFRVMKPIALAIKENVPANAKLVGYRIFEPSLYIYSNRFFPYLEDVPVSEILKSPEQIYIVIKEKDLMQESFAVPYKIISQKKGFAENGGEMTLLLIQNAPSSAKK